MRGHINFVIEDGPTKIELIAALFEGKDDDFNRPRNSVRFLVRLSFLEPFGSPTAEIYCEIAGVKRTNTREKSDEIFRLEARITSWHPESENFNTGLVRPNITECSYNVATKKGLLTLEY